MGRIGWREALEAQLKRLEARRAGAGLDTLLLLEHPPVITLGRRFHPSHLREPRAALAERGIEVHEAARGGSATYHGPGQLVGYLILDLAARGAADAQRFLRGIESDLVAAIDELGVAAHTLPGRTGVFAAAQRAAGERRRAPAEQGREAAAQRAAGERRRAPAKPGRPRKLASIGVGLRGWVSFHGFALNVDLDPADFAPIVPCGLADIEIGTLARELGGDAPADLMQRARQAVAASFAAHWDAS
jgi:lipoate-protein ligase B